MAAKVEGLVAEEEENGVEVGDEEEEGMEAEEEVDGAEVGDMKSQKSKP